MAIQFRVDYDGAVAGAQADWPDGYEYKSGGVQSDQINKRTSPVAQGTYCMEYKVRSGDQTAANQERAEGVYLASDEHLIEGQTRWYGFSAQFDSSWGVSSTVPSNWGIYHQRHAGAAFTQAPIKFDATDGSGHFKLTLSMNTGLQSAGGNSWEYNQRSTLLSSPSTGVWYDHIVGILLDRTANGRVQVYLRNRSTSDRFTRVLNLTNVPTLVWSVADGVENSYLKRGLYRNANSFTNIVYDDVFCYGTSLNDVRAVFLSTGGGQGALASTTASKGSLA